MESLSVLPDRALTDAGIVSKKFLSLGIETFLKACRHVHELPCGYNSDREELLIPFREGNTEDVAPNISGKDEYLLYRGALLDPILLRPELRGVEIPTILRAREEALALLKALVAEA